MVEFLLRSGDLDDRSGGSSDQAMLEGARMHRKIQKRQGASYAPEVTLRTEYVLEADSSFPEDIRTVVEGRADGVYCGETHPDEKGGQVELADLLEREETEEASPEEAFVLPDMIWTVDEIKTTYRKLSGIREPEPVHTAQAFCYAYMLGLERGLEAVQVRMTYCSLDTEEIRHFYYVRTMDRLTGWFRDLMEKYRRWAVLSLSWERIRNASIAAGRFPYPFREGQKELVAGVYATICREKKLFLEAPTGTGKTLAVLYPAIRAMEEGRAEKLFYLTARNVTGKAAEDAFRILEEGGLRMKRVVLTARDKICVCEKASCNPDACPRARGHFDRINDALYRVLTEEDHADRETLLSRAETFGVCPFELSLDVCSFADAVICDYNYVFDPRASLRRFFAEGAGSGKYIFMVDEAHNLLDRARDMYSASVSSEEIRTFRSAVRSAWPGLWKKLGRCLKAVRALPEPEEAYVLLDDISPLADALQDARSAVGKILESQRKGEGAGQTEEKRALQESLLEFYFETGHFLDMYDKAEEDYVFYREGKKEARVRLFCVDPARSLKACMDRGTASILFSATLLPIQYFKGLLGGTAEDYEIYARSVFDPARRGVFVVNDVTSRYSARSDREYERIADSIHRIVSCRHGNYLVFFPSYAFLSMTAKAYLEKYPETEDCRILLQSEGMAPEERAAYLEAFEEVRDDSALLGFGVLGGMFAEGIDLREDRLIGVLVIGTGIPGVCSERQILKDYFDERGESGFDYAYRFPGMNKVLQAGGRVIRTARDVGAVALLDERFAQGQYRKLFPAEWKDYEIVSSDRVGERLARFWDSWL